MTGIEFHLTELKKRVGNCLLMMAGGSLICWFYREALFVFLSLPIQPFLKHTKGALIFTAPLEALLAHLQIAFFFGLLVASPFCGYQIWRFVTPGLYQREKKFFLLFWGMGTGLFLLGVSFVYVVVFPLVFHILLSMGESKALPFITVKHYLSFFIRFALVFGSVFQMPLVLIALCRMHLLSPDTLKKYRKHTIVALALLAAFITPPDIFSQILVLLPLWGLYEISLYLTQLFYQK